MEVSAREEEQQLLVAISSLQTGHSPRLNEVSERHAQLLAERLAELPPILIQRHSMRIIDGMHRVRAAQINGESHILARFFDGDDDSAFIVAVAANIHHGLPLVLADRKAAATRIIKMRPEWSDRMVAKSAGLSWKTVGKLRRSCRGPAEDTQRVGQDGKIRPVSSVDGRQRVVKHLADNPDSSLREIARASRVSPATVRDVRDRLKKGEDPITPKRRKADRKVGIAAVGKGSLKGVIVSRRSTGPAKPHPTPEAIIDSMMNDPSLRYTDSGRILLRWSNWFMLLPKLEQLIERLPAHCIPGVQQLVLLGSEELTRISLKLEDRMHHDGAGLLCASGDFLQLNTRASPAVNR